jgi:copper(I)-binding protein
MEVTARVISAVFVATLAASSAAARDFKVGTLDIRHPWSRPTAEGQ